MPTRVDPLIRLVRTPIGVSAYLLPTPWLQRAGMAFTRDARIRALALIGGIVASFTVLPLILALLYSWGVIH
jgi:hypothetical protein